MYYCTLARVVCQQSRFTDARPLLQSLHWLSIRERILYKTALLTYKTQAISDSTVPGRSASITGTGTAAAVGWCRSAERAVVTNSSGDSCVFCGGTHRLERFAARCSTVWFCLCTHFYEETENCSVQLHTYSVT